jgi:hypothetical protein
MIDRALAQARAQQLRSRHHAVLAGRDGRHHVGWDDFACYGAVNSSHPATVAPSAERNNAEM